MSRAQFSAPSSTPRTTKHSATTNRVRRSIDAAGDDTFCANAPTPGAAAANKEFCRNRLKGKAVGLYPKIYIQTPPTVPKYKSKGTKAMTRVSSKWAEFWATANSEASRGTCKIFQVPNVTRQFFERSGATTIEVLRSGSIFIPL